MASASRIFPRATSCDIRSYSASSKPTTRTTTAADGDAFLGRHIDVEIASAAKGMPAAARLKAWAEAAMEAAQVAPDAELSIRVVDADEMQELNRRFRHRDRPTNVLSFPADAMQGLPDECGVPFGDIAICSDVVEEEARAQCKSSEAHWMHMVVHGVLHLAGFEHDTEASAERMERLEAEILAAEGIDDPYLAR